MSTFIYSPGVQVLIGTEDNGIIDVSEDITRGTLTLTENQSSNLDINLLNHRRKYDGMFTPNDVVVVKLKRIAWMPVFSGYLNQVPFFSIYPRSVRLTASDTLKRLKMSVWDAGSQAAYELMTSVSGSTIGQVDGGLRDKIIALMSEVAGWPSSHIHIGHIPSDWADKFADLKDRLAEQVWVDPNYIGASGVANGTNAAANGSHAVEGDGPGTGTMPATRGKAAYLPTGRTFELTSESARSPQDQWYIAMRWPYRENVSEIVRIDDASNFMTPSEVATAKRWWKNRRILVTNPSNNKAIVVRAVDWGPVDTSGNAALTSREAMTQLSAKVGDTLEYRFAPEGAQLGSYIPPASAVAGADRKFVGTSPIAVSGGPTYVPSEDGPAWTGWNGLQPHVAAARRFVKANWNIHGDIGGAVKRNISGTAKRSDHATGHAIDIGVTKGGSKASGAALAMGNAIAQWFVANPNVFQSKYVIWMDRSNHGSGWRPYKHPGGVYSNTMQHRDHVHVSFKSGSHTQAGAMGGAWPGSSNSDFGNYVGTSNGATFDPGGAGTPGGFNPYTGLVGPDGLPLINAFNWFPTPSMESEAFSGARALLNDTPLLPTIQQLCNSAQRSFMAAPNGDFIAWFPDYFGIYGTASTMVLRDIELANEGFTIAWDDSNLITHQFVAGSHTGYSIMAPGQSVDFTNKLNTMGIATVEFTELMETLFNVSESSPRAKYLRNAESILQRFGARVNYQDVSIISGPEAEFWYAVHLFQKSWASQFSSTLQLSFMPEIWPGMLVKLESFKFQAYVEQVTHTWSMAGGGFGGGGGGFSTDVKVIAPSTTDRSGFYALPLAGEVENAPELVLPRGRANAGVL